MSILSLAKEVLEEGHPEPTRIHKLAKFIVDIYHEHEIKQEHIGQGQFSKISIGDWTVTRAGSVISYPFDIDRDKIPVLSASEARAVASLLLRQADLADKI